jgi:hypothetical protein
MANSYTPKRQYFGPYDPFVECHDDIYRKQDEPGRCGVCGKKTHYKSVHSTEFCCSMECSNELWCDITEKIASGGGKRRRAS